MTDKASQAAAPDARPTVLRREMSITHAEFMRSLPPAIAPVSYAKEGNTITIAAAGGNVIIRLSEERERRIALLRLPVIDVEIEMSGFAPDTAEQFLTQFDRAYRRGGG